MHIQTVEIKRDRDSKWEKAILIENENDNNDFIFLTEDLTPILNNNDIDDRAVWISNNRNGFELRF